MGGMNMAGIDGMKGKDMPAVAKNGMKDMAGMDLGNSSKRSTPSANKSNTVGADQQRMAGMDMSGSGKHAMPKMNKADMAGPGKHGIAGMLMGNAAGTIPFPQPRPNTMPLPGAGASEVKPIPSSPVPMHVGRRLLGLR